MLVVIIRGTEAFMSTVRLTCPCGHSWEHPEEVPVPDTGTICPACLSDDSAHGDRFHHGNRACCNNPRCPGFEGMEINRVEWASSTRPGRSP